MDDVDVGKVINAAIGVATATAVKNNPALTQEQHSFHAQDWFNAAMGLFEQFLPGILSAAQSVSPQISVAVNAGVVLARAIAAANPPAAPAPTAPPVA